jgi:hypothetical protein
LGDGGTFSEFVGRCKKNRVGVEARISESEMLSDVHALLQDANNPDFIIAMLVDYEM